MPFQTEIFRRVFRAIPDDGVTTWKHYKDFIAYHERLLKSPKDDPVSEPLARMPSTARDEHKPDDHGQEHEPRGGEASANFLSAKTVEETLGNGHSRSGGASKHEKSVTDRSTGPPAGEKPGGSMPTEKVNGSATNDKGKKTRGEPPFTKQEREEMETLLDELCGHLVIYPTRFLEGEDVANNFLFNTDRLLPLPIYD